jgi:hypothetical protein
MDEQFVRQLIRHKLLGGRLPRSRAVDVWAAPGDGQVCDGCGEPIARNQQIVWGIATRDWTSIQFHADCFQIWDAERLALSPQEPDARSGDS